MRNVAAVALPWLPKKTRTTTCEDLSTACALCKCIWHHHIATARVRSCPCISLSVVFVCRKKALKRKSPISSSHIALHLTRCVYIIHRLPAFVYRMSISLSLYIFSNDLIHIRNCICAIENILIHMQHGLHGCEVENALATATLFDIYHMRT